MTVHWTSMTTDARIDAVRAAWYKGASTRNIAAMIGVTKGVISGMYNRHAKLLLDCPRLAPSLKLPEGLRKSHHAKTAKATALPPVPESQLAGMTLMMLKPRHCKWAVNDAPKGDEHLFCGIPTAGVYCEHHASRSYRFDVR